MTEQEISNEVARRVSQLLEFDGLTKIEPKAGAGKEMGIARNRTKLYQLALREAMIVTNALVDRRSRARETVKVWSKPWWCSTEQWAEIKVMVR